MSPFRGLTRTWRFAVRKILGLWVRVTIKPEEIAESISARRRPVCYVLENESRSDFAVLDNACAALGIPKPDRCFALVRQGAFLGARLRRRAPRQLVQLVEFASREPSFDLDLIPVAIYFGRAPEKEQSLWRLVFTEEWVLLGRFRKLLNVLFNGRNTVVYFGEPIGCARRWRTASAAAQRAPGAAHPARRIARAARLDHRAGSVASPHHGRAHPAHASRAPRRARRDESRLARARTCAGARARQLNRAARAVLRTARKDAMEIAANYSQSFVRSWPPPWAGYGLACTTAWSSSTWRSCTRSATAPRSSTCPVTAAIWIICCSPT